MLLELVKKDGKKILVNILNVTIEETDFGLYVYLPSGDKVQITETMNDIRYALMRVSAVSSNGNNNLVTQ